MENIENLANMCERVQQRAIERDSEQTVTLVFGAKTGFVRHINGSDNMNGTKPKKYVAE